LFEELYACAVGLLPACGYLAELTIRYLRFELNQTAKMMHKEHGITKSHSHFAAPPPLPGELYTDLLQHIFLRPFLRWGRAPVLMTQITTSFVPIFCI